MQIFFFKTLKYIFITVLILVKSYIPSSSWS